MRYTDKNNAGVRRVVRKGCSDPSELVRATALRFFTNRPPSNSVTFLSGLLDQLDSATQHEIRDAIEAIKKQSHQEQSEPANGNDS